jgi:hypothetical protein
VSDKKKKKKNKKKEKQEEEEEEEEQNGKPVDVRGPMYFFISTRSSLLRVNLNWV